MAVSDWSTTKAANITLGDMNLGTNEFNINQTNDAFQQIMADVKAQSDITTQSITDLDDALFVAAAAAEDAADRAEAAAASPMTGAEALAGTSTDSRLVSAAVLHSLIGIPARIDRRGTDLSGEVMTTRTTAISAVDLGTGELTAALNHRMWTGQPVVVTGTNTSFPEDTSLKPKTF